MDINEWHEKQKFKNPQYSHFDLRVSLSQRWSYLSNPVNVSKHGFYPFIHYNLKNRKIVNGKKAEPKIRNIYYAAHLDGWIYKYYSYRLNELYNRRVIIDNISSVSVAYRTDLNKSNIQFAHQAISFIKSSMPCHVMIGDFTDFFDNLNHIYLKQRLCDLLEVEELPADFYNVLKNVTKFSFWELEDLLTLNNLDLRKSSRKKLNKKSRVLSVSDFHLNRKNIKPNPKKGLGVPQGSPISAVLANIFMMVADKHINEYVQSLNGFYMRYSDDFMIVLPKTEFTDFLDQYKWIITEFRSIPNLTLHDKKTRIFQVTEGCITNCTNQYAKGVENGKNIIDFLGFSFDGNSITIRGKTISKYYYRMYRKINSINGKTQNVKSIKIKKLYLSYSYKGTAKYQKNHGNAQKTEKHQGNFLDYVNRAKSVFKDEPIDKGVKKHMQKIRKRLEKINEPQ